jgi:hypothetical protein
VYAYSDDSDETLGESEILDRLIFSGVPSNGVLKQTINVPNTIIKYISAEMKA